jgi:F-type H+/Na+-transporting ATPase subunit alpha
MENLEPVVVRVESASDLTEAQHEKLSRQLRAALGREPLLQVTVNRELEAGIRLQVGNQVLDGTVATQLAALKSRRAPGLLPGTELTSEAVESFLREQHRQLTPEVKVVPAAPAAPASVSVAVQRQPLSEDSESNDVLSPLTVRVETAVDLSAVDQEKLRRQLNKSLGRETNLEVRINPDLVAGIRLQVGNQMIDGTVVNQLERFDGIVNSGDSTILAKTMTTEQIGHYFQDYFQDFAPEVKSFEVGTVVQLGDGIANVAGLSGVMAGELVSFEHNVSGLVLNLEKDKIGCIIFGNDALIKEGEMVRRTGRFVEVPVGQGLLGRVVNALGQPIDGKGIIKAESSRPVDAAAPGIIDRTPVHQPLETGIKAIDAMIPIGRGQRELIIGDRRTGKSALALSAIINQKDKDVVCIYVAIGQKASTIASIVDTLAAHGAMEYTTIVAATASEPAPLQYLAPYAGCAMGEHFMYEGKHVLIVYDDLSKHAVAYRALSLLLRRPPGREAYPGDIFYLHGRLLERAAKLSDELGGGSMTALPIIETQAGDVAAYIPTNVISITDGQIFLESDLFFAGIRPAVNVGLSVSRVGGAAQSAAMKQFASHLRLDLSQFRELASYAQLGSQIDQAMQGRLERGQRIVEVLKQDQLAPMPIADQVLIIFAAVRGLLDQVPMTAMKECEPKLIEAIRLHHIPLYEHLVSGARLNKELRQKLGAAVTEFVTEYLAAMN